MNKIYQKSTRGIKNAGFTLIELLVAALIIGILAAVALTQYEKAIWRSRAASLQMWTAKLLDAQQRYYMNSGHYTQCLNLLDIDYQSSFPDVIEQQTGWYDGGDWVDDCVLSAKDRKTPGTTISVSLFWPRAVFSSGKYELNGFGAYLNLPEADLKMGGIWGMCTIGGNNMGWKKILNSMRYTKQVVGNYACYQQLNQI